MNIRIFLPFVLLGALAQGQMGPGPGGMMGPGFGPGAQMGQRGLDDIKTYLNLTDAQIQNMQQTRQNAYTNLRTTFDQMRAKHTALRDLLDKGTTDAAAVGKLVLDMEALRKQVQQAQAAVRTQLVAQLTPAQQAKLKTLEDSAKLEPAIHGAYALGLLTPPEGHGFGMMGGPGMMHGPGPARAPGMGRGRGPM